MTTDKLQKKEKAKKDTNWTILAKQAEREIKHLQARMKKLHKSFVFFKKQEELGIPFPIEKIARHVDLS